MTERSPIDCEEALRRLADYLHHELGQEEHAEMDHHMEACRGCFSRAEFERRLTERLTEAGKESAPASVRERVRKILGEY